MEIRCIIVDDEPAAIRVVENYLEKLNNVVVVGKCNSAFDTIKLLTDNEIDLMFLDINMPSFSGIELLKSLRQPPVIVITTAYREYAVESFDLEVIDYLHKPYSFDRFFRAIQRVEEKLKLKNQPLAEDVINTDSKDHIFIKSEKKHHKIQFSDLLFIEAMGDYCKIITIKTTYLSYLTLKRLNEMLPDNFIRVHKSFIIQVDKIEQIEGNTIKIDNQKIPVGFSYREVISKLLKD